MRTASLCVYTHTHTHTHKEGERDITNHNILPLNAQTLAHTHSTDTHPHPSSLKMQNEGVKKKSSTVEHSWLNQSIQTASKTPISFSKTVCHSAARESERER